MRKLKWSKILVFLVAIMAALLLSGCEIGANVSTMLAVNDDLSGSRYIDATVNENAFSQYFSGSKEDLERIISENCPAGMSWQLLQSDPTIYRFQINFANPRQYKKIVEGILGYEVQLEILAPDSVWATGFSVQESFESTELLSWLTSAMVDNGYIDSAKTGYVWESTENNIYYKNETYSTHSRLNFDNTSYVAFNGLTITTTVNGLDNFDRTIVYDVPVASMQQKDAEIRTYLGGLVPANAQSTWTDYENGTMLTIAAEQMDAAALQAFTQTALGTEGCTLEVAEYQDGAILDFNGALYEFLDLHNFITNNNGTSVLTYELLTTGNMQLLGADYMKYSAYADEPLVVYEGKRTGSAECALRVRKSYAVDKLSAKISNSGSKVQETYKVTLAAVPTEEEQAAIEAKLAECYALQEELAEGAASSEAASQADSAAASQADSAAASQAESGEASEADASQAADSAASDEKKDKPKNKVAEIEADASEEAYTLTIKLAGTADEVNELTNSSDTPLRAFVIFGREAKPLATKNDIGGYCEMWMGTLTSSYSSTYQFEFELTNGLFSKITSGTDRYGTFAEVISDADVSRTIHGGTYTLNSTLEGCTVMLKYVGTQLNVAAVAIYLLLALAIVCLLLWVKMSGLLQKAPRPYPVQAGPMQAGPMQAGPMLAAPQAPTAFCANCGAPLTPGTPFCENCGAKVEAEIPQQVPVMSGAAYVPATELMSAPNPAVQQNVPEKRYCSNCGAELSSDSTFCEYCGTKN